MTARSLVIILVFLPSCEVEIAKNGVNRMSLTVVVHSVFFLDLLKLLSIHPVAPLGVVVAEVQIGPCSQWPGGITALARRIESSFEFESWCSITSLGPT